MNLYLIRHGIAMDREDPDCPPDAERPLTPKGIKKTQAAMRGFLALKIKPDAVLSSPWLRAMQTAEIFCEIMEYSANKIVRTDALKGNSSPPDLFHELAGLKKKEVVCVGHEPHLHELIALALRTHSRVTELKKAGIACLELEQISPPQGQLVALYPPSTLRLLGK